jgi:geranylgeranyl reductase family protein
MPSSIDILYDATIVGAGPAGSVVAYGLAKKGISVLLLEKENFPRIKPCGGGVTAKAAQLLPFDLKNVIENTISGIKYSYKLGPEKERNYGKPLIYLVSRDKFDDFLLQKAIEAGAVVKTGAGVELIERTTDSVIVRAANETYSARIVVGTDGANSVVAKAFGLTGKRNYDVGLDCQVVPKNYDPDAWKGFVKFDYGDIRGGYGWVFPKREMLSIGAGGPAGSAKKLKLYLERLIARQNLGPYEIKSLKGHFIPMRRRGSPITGERVLLVGDSAGLVEPFSGEGMYNAILSAQMAVEVIADYLDNPESGLSRYEALVDEKIMTESDAARQILKISRFAPKTSFGLLNSSDRVWNAVCRVLRGEKKYSEFKEVLGPGKAVFRLLG